MSEIHAEVVVLGSGPGGYTAAFRAADLGKKVVLIERYSSIGGVCLNVGCIPSKALLHTAKVLDETKEFTELGIEFNLPKIDHKKLAKWKEGVIAKLTGGLKHLAKQRKVTIVEGTGAFVSDDTIEVTSSKGIQPIKFEHAIIAAGSRPIKLPFLPDDPRIIDSTGALELQDIPENMLVIGGGIIGMEMAAVYNALGSKITVVELTPSILPGVDKDIVQPLQKRVQKLYEKIMLNTKVTKVEAKDDGLWVTFEGKEAPAGPVRFDKILSAVGRIPNSKDISAEKAGVKVDGSGFIVTDKQMRTNVPNIFAIGDIVGQPMLAHKAIPEGKVAAEVICGHKAEFAPRCIPNVAYTDPEVSWVGLTEIKAQEKSIEYEKGVFPWAASGRALSMGRSEGITKLLSCPKTKRILGAGIVGLNAGDLIAEVALAIEMGADVEDLALTIHPHPTLAETVAQAAEMIEGTITDLIAPKKKSNVEKNKKSA